MPAPKSSDAVLIAGGGIAGLSAAIALARNGERVRLHERTKSFPQIGAGIQLGPNATRILRGWGVLDALEKKYVRAEGIGMGSGVTGEMIARVPLGDMIEERHGAPYIMLHRADLHAALFSVARAFPGVEIRKGVGIEGFEQFPGQVIAETSRNATRGKALIAADGVWSSLRNLVDPTAALTHTDKTAWRTLLDPGELPEELQGAWIGLWMAPDAHLVHYPVRGGKAVNLVAVIEERWVAREGWDQEADPQVLMHHFRNWDSRLQAMIEAGENWGKWSLFDLAPMHRSTMGNVALIGDAAHPVPPFLAQGGALAIEDAAVMANHFIRHDSDTVMAFAEFENDRIARTARTRYESRRMGRIYHMGGLARMARDFVLSRRPPEALLGKFDWLYGYDALAP